MLTETVASIQFLCFIVNLVLMCECISVYLYTPIYIPILRVREASIVLNCCSLVCIRLARLQRIGGIVCVFLSEENSLETHAS